MSGHSLTDAERGTLGLGEPHPAAAGALRLIRSLSFAEQATWAEAFASCAIEGNRLAEVCSETMRRIMAGEPVSDRYVLGLVWAIGPNRDRASFVRALPRSASIPKTGFGNL